MSNKSYFSSNISDLPRPAFVPGFDAKASSIMSLTLKTLGIATTVIVLQTNHNNVDSTILGTKPNQLIIIDQAPRFINEDISNEAVAIPYIEHASLVSSALGLGKSDIARILGISRPTLYSWIKGASEPRDSDHPERLRRLGELTADICKESKRPLYHRFVEEPLPNQPISIFNLLLAEDWDIAELRKLFAEARRLTSERDQRLGHIPTSVNKAKQESNLLDNSIALNLE